MDKKKQKQIEEMANVVRKYYSGFSDYKVAEEIYRILIPENAVVLTREEYEKVDKEIINKSTYDTIWKAGYNAYEKTVGECVTEARKETAEKFAEMLKEELENCSAIDGYDLEDLEFDGEIIQQCIDKILSEIRQMLR